MKNDELREAAVGAVANYMHHELFEITGDTQMLPWLTEQAKYIMSICDSAIRATKDIAKGK
jgi:hypothetical protein